MTRKKMYNYEVLAEEYHKGTPLGDIMKRFGCTNKTILTAVRSCGGDNSRNVKIDSEMIDNELSSGERTASELASLVNKSTRAMRNYLAKNNYPYRIDDDDKRKTKIFSGKVKNA